MQLDDVNQLINLAIASLGSNILNTITYIITIGMLLFFVIFLFKHFVK